MFELCPLMNTTSGKRINKQQNLPCHFVRQSLLKEIIKIMEKHITCKNCGAKLIVYEVNSMPGNREEEIAYCIQCHNEVLRGFISGIYKACYDTDNENSVSLS